MEVRAPASHELSADYIWTGEGDPFPGRIRVVDGRIADLVAGVRADEHYPGLLTAGLVNAHVHLDLSFPPEADRLDGPFTDWLLRIKALRDDAGDAGLAEAARRGVKRLLASGCTLLFDYDSGAHSLAALAESRIRRVIFREVIRFHDDAAVFDELAEFFGEAQQSHATRELRAIAPHAPYTVHPKLMQRLVDEAGRRELPWSTHIAEQPWEEEFLVKGTGPLAEFFAKIGIDVERYGVRGQKGIASLSEGGAPPERLRGGWFIHGNYLDGDEIAELAAAEATVVFCPRSHRWFGHTPHPLDALREAGVAWCLGTDGQVSSGDLSVWAEMREVRRQFPDCPADEIFRAAIVTPRVQLGRQCADFGSGQLRPGDPADLCVVEAPGDARDLLDNVLSADPNVLATYVDGARLDTHAD